MQDVDALRDILVERLGEINSVFTLLTLSVNRCGELSIFEGRLTEVYAFK